MRLSRIFSKRSSDHLPTACFQEMKESHRNSKRFHTSPEPVREDELIEGGRGKSMIWFLEGEAQVPGVLSFGQWRVLSTLPWSGPYWLESSSSSSFAAPDVLLLPKSQTSRSCRAQTYSRAVGIRHSSSCCCLMKIRPLKTKKVRENIVFR